MTMGRAARQAVVDIGSNSVRLVIYGAPERAPITIFNEKELCGLGRRDPKTGELSERAMKQALKVLGRFKAVCTEMGNPNVRVVATAAMREAPNGADFIEQVAATGFKPEILSGVEEARLAALGVLSGAPDIIQNSPTARSHLCGDMGGGSLELVRYSDDFLKPVALSQSYELGPLRLISQYGPIPADAEKAVHKILKKSQWLTAEKTETLHAVGGAWRALARIHQAVQNYPLKTLHHYQMAREDIIEICQLVEKQSPEGLTNIPGIQRKRIETLPHAAMVLRLLLELTKARNIIISSFGVREGILFDQLTSTQQLEDPLFAIATEYAVRLNPNPQMGGKLLQFLDSLFVGETPRERHLRQAACSMVDIAALSHPDERPLQACETALRAPLVALTHGERVALAASLFYRYRAKRVDLPQTIPASLMGQEQWQWAERVGLAMRFASDLSPKSGHVLGPDCFVLTEDKIIFRLSADMQPLFSQMVHRRLQLVAQSFERELEVIR